MQIIEHMPSPVSPLPFEPSGDPLSHPTRDDRRVDLEGTVTLHFSEFESPVTERTQNVSATGMFIQTQSLQPMGTAFRFSLDLANGLEPIEGRAAVIWVRRQNDGLFRPAGMGARFVDLDEESQQLMRWSVEYRTRELRKFLNLDAVEADPVEPRSAVEDLRLELEHALADDSMEPSALAELRDEVDVALRDVLESSLDHGAAQGSASDLADVDRHRMHPYAGCASTTGSATRAGRVWRILSAIPLVPLAVLCLYILSPAPEPAAATPTVAEPPPVAAESLAAASLVLQPIAPELEEAPQPSESDLEELTLAWADAWSRQRARTYLAFYSPGFVPPDALSRADWEALREERILKPRSIRVEVRDLETEILSPERARVSFDQIYRSDRFHDQVRKTFELVRGEQGWQILEERAEPAA